MIDFTSALYLGLDHASVTLPGWHALTLGRPAALDEPSGAERSAAELARLQGLAAATLLPSTLHLFWDLLRLLSCDARTALLLDAGAYPILRWAADGAVAVGARLHVFAHHDVAALAQLTEQVVRAGLRPVVVCDGFCPGCNRVAPLRAYSSIAQASGGALVLDDTQALGVLGQAPSADRPYGRGGGGTLRWHGLAGEHIAVGASLAKGFGAPLAALSGSTALIARFRRGSATRLHCSPPSAASIQAAQRALEASRACADHWRVRLLRLVMQLRETLARAGLAVVGRLPFPVQSFVARPGRPDVAHLLSKLQTGGVRALLTHGCGAPTPRLSLIITTRHRTAQLDHVGRLLAGSHAFAPRPATAD